MWFELQDLLAKQNPEAFWNCIVKMVQYHAVKQSTATAAQLLTDDNTLNYLVSLAQICASAVVTVSVDAEHCHCPLMSKWRVCCRLERVQRSP